MIDIINLMRNAKAAEREMNKRASAAIRRDIAFMMTGAQAFGENTFVEPESIAAVCDALHEAGFDPPECEGEGSI